MEFDFVSAGRIVFGCGSSKCVGSLLSGLTSGGVCGQVLVVHGQRGLEAYGGSGRFFGEDTAFRVTSFVLKREPTVEDISEGARLAALGCDAVVAIGGGSCMDAGKAIAIVATNGGDALDFMEVVGRGKELQNAPLPFIAVPTTAGTGSEVTKNAVVKSTEHNLKASIRSEMMLPKIAVIDPELHKSMPWEVTAASGMDALTQCIEPYVSVKANAMTDILARRGIELAAASLLEACQHPDQMKARSDMALASTLSGLALANSKLGAVHGLAGVIGGMSDSAGHGQVCAVLLAPVFAANAEALRGRNDVLQKFRDVSCIVTGNPNASIEDGVAYLKKLTSDLKIPGLQRMGIEAGMLESIAELSEKTSSMKGNPIPLSKDVLLAILQEAF